METEKTKDYEKDKNKPIPTHYGQIVATICQVMWTQNSEDAITQQAGDPLSLQDWVEK